MWEWGQTDRVDRATNHCSIFTGKITYYHWILKMEIHSESWAIKATM